MQDGLPPHFALTVCTWLGNHFSKWSIGHKEQME